MMSSLAYDLLYHRPKVPGPNDHLLRSLKLYAKIRFLPLELFFSCIFHNGKMTSTEVKVNCVKVLLTKQLEKVVTKHCGITLTVIEL